MKPKHRGFLIIERLFSALYTVPKVDPRHNANKTYHSSTPSYTAAEKERVCARGDIFGRVQGFNCLGLSMY